LAYGSGVVFINPDDLFSANSNNESIKISMVYNNTGTHTSMSAAWSLSILTETKEQLSQKELFREMIYMNIH